MRKRKTLGDYVPGRKRRLLHRPVERSPARMGTHPSAAIDHVSLFFFPSFFCFSLSHLFLRLFDFVFI